jgi:DNA-directed RNA polymerase specialized sigma24 family protein
VTSADYSRAVTIARRACAAQWAWLSLEDREEVIQDTALAMWRTGNITRMWWAAINSATDHQQGRRIHKPTETVALTWDVAAHGDVADEVCDRLATEWLLGRLPSLEGQAIVETVIIGRTQQSLADELGVADSTITRRRAMGLARLRRIADLAD